MNLDFTVDKDTVVLGSICSGNAASPLNHDSIYPHLTALRSDGGVFKVTASLDLQHIENALGLFTVNRIKEEANIFLCGCNEKLLLVKFKETRSIFERFKVIENQNFGIIYNLSLSHDSLIGYSDKMERIVKINIGRDELSEPQLEGLSVEIQELSFDNQFDISHLAVDENRQKAILVTKNTITSYTIEDFILKKQATLEKESKPSS